MPKRHLQPEQLFESLPFGFTQAVVSPPGMCAFSPPPASTRPSGNNTAVELYWDADPDLVGGPFGEHNDTRSRDHWILGKGAKKSQPRWSVIRNVLGWVD